MSNQHIAPRLVVIAVAFTVLAVTAAGGCADEPTPRAPDAMPSPVPLDPAGSYIMQSSFSLAAPPASAVTMLASLATATDGPDDPSRYLIDKLVARLPEGRAQVIAAAVAPYLAAYVQRRVDRFAPKLADGVRGIVDGVNRIARHPATTEELTIEASGRARHTFIGFRYDGIDIGFASAGLADSTSETQVAIERAPETTAGNTTGNTTTFSDKLVLSGHAITLDYGALLRLGLDRVVVPRTVPGANDLASALDALVDCDALGIIVAEYIGVGEPALYAGACAVALTRVAAEVYAQLDVPPLQLMIAGSAQAIDLDGDGPMDVIKGGAWVGTWGDAPIAGSVFDGATP